MLTEKMKEKLKSNWGDKASALDCYAEVRFIDRLSRWSCYIFALDPVTEDSIMCFIPHSYYDEIMEWSLKDLYSCYDKEGEPLTIDEEYRPTHIRTLIQRYGNDTRRD